MEIRENSIFLTTEETEREIFGDNVIEKIKGIDLRRGICMTSIIEINGRFFSIDWVKAATEMQEHEIHGGEFPEVVQKEKIIKIWVDKE